MLDALIQYQMSGVPLSEKLAGVMQVKFIGSDRTKKPWFGKVLAAARDELRALLEEVVWDSVPEMFAEFDLEEAGRVVLHERIQGNDRILAVIFAAKGWVGLSTSRVPATIQLGAALRALAPAHVSEMIRCSIQAAGIETEFPVARTSTELSPDRRQHIVVMLSQELPESTFMELYDSVDQALHAAAAGEVTGSGVGLMGWNLDVSLNKRAVGRSILRDQLSKLPEGILVRASVEGSDKPFHI